MTAKSAAGPFISGLSWKAARSWSLKRSGKSELKIELVEIKEEHR